MRERRCLSPKLIAARQIESELCEMMNENGELFFYSCVLYLLDMSEIQLPIGYFTTALYSSSVTSCIHSVGPASLLVMATWTNSLLALAPCQ